MQIGHVAVACVIASFAPELTGGRIDAFSTEALIVAFVAHWLPNLDSIPIWLKWAKPNYMVPLPPLRFHRVLTPPAL
jgi:hypothetical protein